MLKAIRFRARIRRLRTRIRMAVLSLDFVAVAMLAAPFGLALIYYASLAFWDVGPLRSQPSYVRYGLPAFFLFPFMIAYALDRSHMRLQFVAITAGISATFLGTSLAFIQADVQSAANEREVFSRIIESAMDELSYVDEARASFADDELQFNLYAHRFSRLSTLLKSELQFKFLTRLQRYELDLAQRSLATYGKAYRNHHLERDERLANRDNYYGVVDGLYANLCALRHQIRGEFDMQQISGALQVSPFISFHKPIPTVLDKLPSDCRKVASIRETIWEPMTQSPAYPPR